MKLAKSILFAILRVALVAYLVLCALLYFCQERLLFHPTPLDPNHSFKFELGFEQHWIEDGDEQFDSLLFKAPNAKGTVLYFHGNASTLADWGHIAARFVARTGWNAWVIDYPGYGRSEGTIKSEAQLHRLAEAFYKQATATLGSGEKFVIYGRSVGTGLAVKLAATQTVAAVILEAPYTSIASMARQMYPWAPTFLLRYPLRSDEWIGKVKSPILIVHGEGDQLIPFEHGKALAAMNPQAKLAAIPVGNHNDIEHFESYWTAVTEFLNGLGR